VRSECDHCKRIVSDWAKAPGWLHSDDELEITRATPVPRDSVRVLGQDWCSITCLLSALGLPHDVAGGPHNW